VLEKAWSLVPLASWCLQQIHEVGAIEESRGMMYITILLDLITICEELLQLS